MPHRKEMLRFCIAGGIITATDFSIYYVLFHFLPFNIAKGISFASAGIVGYLLSKYWTFKKNKPSFTEILRYASINLLALAINVFINDHILSQWPGEIFIALIITTLVTGLFTFICFKWWVFRPLK
jgi:putative flippase GtrA